MKHTPFRYDYVGSFLRTEKLKEARQAYFSGTINSSELKKVEDECITELIMKIKELGYPVITDGEFRRSWWHLDFFWGLNGIEKRITRDGLHFHGEVTKAESAVITGRISGENHPFIEHFRFVKQFEDDNTVAKQTIPSPAQLLVQLRLPEFSRENKAIYPDDEELKNDIVRAYHQVIADLYEAGCRNLQPRSGRARGRSGQRSRSLPPIRSGWRAGPRQGRPYPCGAGLRTCGKAYRSRRRSQ